MAEPGLLHAPFQMFQELICDPSLIFSMAIKYLFGCMAF